MRNHYRIKFFCRSFDLRLYRLSKGLYESLGYPCVRLTDQTADGYFHTMLQDTDCDIAINVDEDCFLTNTDAVFELVDYAVENKHCQYRLARWRRMGATRRKPISYQPFLQYTQPQTAA